MIECIFTDSDCMNSGKQSINPVGIIVHSTGVNQTSVGRWAQPSKDDPNRDELLKIIGKNKYNNHWNRPNVDKATHYMIGKIADGTVEVIKCLPHNVAGWGVGRGSKGSYNYNPYGHIQIETCEDSLKNEEYFRTCYNKIVELCAHICIEENLPYTSVISHKECAKMGYGSNHKDIDHWLVKWGKSMDNMREDIRKKIDELTPVENDKFKGDIELNGVKYFVEGTFRIIE